MAYNGQSVWCGELDSSIKVIDAECVHNLVMMTVNIQVSETKFILLGIITNGTAGGTVNVYACSV